MDQVKRYGGHPGIRDVGLLLSAGNAWPRSEVNSSRDIFEAAAAYASTSAANIHSSTAISEPPNCALVFLELNATEIRDSDGTLHASIIDIALGRLSKQQLAHVLRRHSLDRRLAR